MVGVGGVGTGNFLSERSEQAERNELKRKSNVANVVSGRSMMCFLLGATGEDVSSSVQAETAMA